MLFIKKFVWAEQIDSYSYQHNYNESIFVSLLFIVTITRPRNLRESYVLRMLIMQRELLTTMNAYYRNRIRFSIHILSRCLLGETINMPVVFTCDFYSFFIMKNRFNKLLLILCNIIMKI